jgi:rubrerythrin
MERRMMKNPELMTLDEILQAALAREEESRDFYGNLAMHCREDFVRDLMQRLQGEEAKHVYLVQDMITKLNLGKDVV